MFLGASFSLVYTPTSPDASFTQKFKDSGWILVTGSSYNFATETDINVNSMQCRRKRKWVGRARNLCRSRWDHVDIVFRHKVITSSGIRPPRWSLWVNEASGEVGMYIIEKLAPQNIGIATEIVSISVSVAELLVVPVWGYVSTSGLYLMLFSEVGRRQYRWKWIRIPENCVVAAYITFISLLFSSRHQLITTSGLRPPYWVYKCRKCTTWLMWVRRKKLRTKITGISSLAGTEPEILLGVIYPSPTCNIRYKNTLAIGGLIQASCYSHP